MGGGSNILPLRAIRGTICIHLPVHHIEGKILIF